MTQLSPDRPDFALARQSAKIRAAIALFERALDQLEEIDIDKATWQHVASTAKAADIAVNVVNRFSD